MAETERVCDSAMGDQGGRRGGGRERGREHGLPHLTAQRENVAEDDVESHARVIDARQI